MFNTLTERLSGALQKLSGRGRISEDNIRQTVRQIRMALLEADVALPVAKSFVARVRQRALGEEVARSLNPGQAFTKIVNDELIRVLGGGKAEIEGKGNPAVVLLVAHTNDYPGYVGTWYDGVYQITGGTIVPVSEG